MATAKKNSNGKWVATIYLGKDYSGKRCYKKITADSKREVDRLIAKTLTEEKPSSYEDMSIGECIKMYIDVKESVLSPYTVTGYRKLLKNAYSEISGHPLSKINQVTVQTWVSRYSVKHSAKTVKNAYGLLHSAIKMFRPELVMHITLPQSKRVKRYVPTISDIEKVLEISRPKMRIAIMLAAFCSLRRGEICALEYEDIDYKKNLLTIDKAMVRHSDGSFSIQQPKTASSNRTIPVPQFLMDEIGHGTGRIVEMVPHSITVIFDRTVATAGVHDFRFHDLRHFYASELHAQGIPDAYIEESGGWAYNSSVMKTVYRNTISDEQKKNSEKILYFFENKMQKALKKAAK